MRGHEVRHNVGGAIGRAVVDHHDAVHEVGHGFEHRANLAFFVVGGHYNRYGLAVKHAWLTFSETCPVLAG